MAGQGEIDAEDLENGRGKATAYKIDETESQAVEFEIQSMRGQKIDRKSMMTGQFEDRDRGMFT